MLISKRSPRRSALFSSKFRDGRGTDFPVRQYLRCRDDFFSGILYAILTLVFLVTLAGFTRSIAGLFDHHGAELSPLYRYLSLGLMGLFMLSVLRRLYYKVIDLFAIRQEMTGLQATFRTDQPEI